ncbi:cytochrome-c oxidase, cbb3-type subunit II [Solemya pervernicosa gill symbiont]|uniref:Cytochrome-c oxidase, cbb3-type subunit II n=2 Tax=Gammaproteobacteria incertae sedis TaxID=118884 RepID=A0A1T2L7B1_9GAMM|nr:cytochrome-c oxidase, cbb3-type subunit II [Candidatus Reidiella endopervernicosa]OOZ40971.1 cytochrome-c oxidase, cbb3-type subunit II [Solemya pervernicosa gill symbiont]QKQ25019.1 cytochrome-c oxidase, cbb3-type subunit II [Candidatus Reidiella endopervernicosa]
MANQIHSTKLQDTIERKVFVMLVFLLVLLSVGGIVEIVPLFYLKDTMEHNKSPEIAWERGDKSFNDWKAGDGVRPYTPLELAGRDVYIREGCYTCHSQMIRPFRDEKERYGHYSLASESMYDHPFQWGSKRTGPDLARVGGKYSDDWHIRHLRAPRSVVPESVMPNYPWFDENIIDGDALAANMGGLRMVGVPYTDADIASAAAEVQGKTEMDAMVAYLQVMGTMVKFDETKDYRE